MKKIIKDLKRILFFIFMIIGICCNIVCASENAIDYIAYYKALDTFRNMIVIYIVLFGFVIIERIIKNNSQQEMVTRKQIKDILFRKISLKNVLIAIVVFLLGVFGPLVILSLVTNGRISDIPKKYIFNECVFIFVYLAIKLYYFLRKKMIESNYIKKGQHNDEWLKDEKWIYYDEKTRNASKIMFWICLAKILVLLGFYFGLEKELNEFPTINGFTKIPPIVD